MKNAATLFLKAAVLLIGLATLALGLIGIYVLCHYPIAPSLAFILYPIILGIYVTSIPFFLSLFQAFKLLGYIEKKQTYTAASVIALGTIKKCALSIAIVYTVIFPFVFQLAGRVDPPAIIPIGTFLIFASIVIVAFSSLLQNLLKESIQT